MTTDTYRIDIRSPVISICQALEIDYADVAEITLRPNDVTVTLLKRNEHGSHYIETVVKEAAVETRTFQVRT